MKFIDWITHKTDADVRARVRAALPLRMTTDEREKAREFLTRYVAMHPATAATPRSQNFLWHPMPVLASLLIIVVTGVAGAAELALPGDVLYAVKVNVNEEVRLALASKDSRAEFALTRAERRLEELNALHDREINETLRDEIDARLDAHVHAAEEASLRSDEDTERRVVALLRAHETLVAPGEIGGFVEPEIDGAAFALVDPIVHVTQTTELPVATMMMVAEDPSMQARVSESAPIETSLAATPEIALMNTEDISAKQASASISEKMIERQERTARERIAALEKFIAREEKQNAKRENPRDTSVLTAGLEGARDALANAQRATEDNNTFDASALFNSAIRFAIDAREAYVERARNAEQDRRFENRANDRDR